MVIANPRIHIICGVCGNKDMFSFRIQEKGVCDNDGTERDGVYISCGNCATLTGLEELIKEETNND